MLRAFLEEMGRAATTSAIIATTQYTCDVLLFLSLSFFVRMGNSVLFGFLMTLQRLPAHSVLWGASELDEHSDSTMRILNM